MMSPPASSLRVAVLGAGITGLTTAWHLTRAGFSPVVFERAGRVGGAIGATETDGWLHELGPNSLLEGSPEVAAFIDQLDLGDRRLYASPAAKQRYVVRQGQLVAMPLSPWGFVTTKLFSLRAKLALLGEPWRKRSAPEEEESVSEFVVRRLGREFLDYAVNPLVGGVYAGDPARLSVRHAFPKLHALEQEHGSLIRGALKRRNTSGGPKGRIFSFPKGLGELPAALAQQLGEAVRLGHTVLSVSRQHDEWQLRYQSPSGPQVASFDVVISALPADALAALHLEGVPGASELKLLREIDQPAVASIFTGFRREDVRHPLDGFGVLVPAVERRKILGTLFSSTLFPGRAPAGYVGLTTFAGGMRNPEVAALSDAALVQIVRDELRALVGARGEPVFTHVQRWPRAIPQYALGYERHQQAMRTVEANAPGFFIGGNCRDGISLANCIAAGRRLADATVAFSGQPAPALAGGRVESH